jgi:hypothetical protein
METSLETAGQGLSFLLDFSHILQCHEISMPRNALGNKHVTVSNSIAICQDTGSVYMKAALNPNSMRNDTKCALGTLDELTEKVIDSCNDIAKVFTFVRTPVIVLRHIWIKVN